ncbi:peptidoglycan DD-metalloendopeptidase family protein [Candidatus Uhrbacteria bacterium]|nr:peptidoglycan DD-metalloendopeptidase family protein [Candidatus Uhrbacteria bacterium]
MVQIEIEVPRPIQTVLLCAGIAGVVGFIGMGTTEGAMGGLGMRAQLVVKEAEQTALQIREQQEVLAHQEEILRSQLEQLTRQHAENADSPLEPAYWAARQKLIELLQDKSAAEQTLLASLQQMWQAQGGAAIASVGASGTIRLQWPVSPDEGISAKFRDAGYRKRFHMEHFAIDIPVPQGTVIGAADDGVVLAVTDQGMGFNSLTIRHKNGFVTLYGHVSAFLVQEGETVQAGQPIARSGGLQNTPGAGWLTTGPHLHFQVLEDGQPVDPLKSLPAVPGVQ